MNDKTLFLIFFFFILFSFVYGTDEFYGRFDCFSSLQFDDVTWRLISIAIAALLCASYWNYYISNYV